MPNIEFKLNVDDFENMYLNLNFKFKVKCRIFGTLRKRRENVQDRRKSNIIDLTQVELIIENKVREYLHMYMYDLCL